MTEKTFEKSATENFSLLGEKSLNGEETFYARNYFIFRLDRGVGRKSICDQFLF
jgi:hypothetical protein